MFVQISNNILVLYNIYIITLRKVVNNATENLIAISIISLEYSQYRAINVISSM